MNLPFASYRRSGTASVQRLVNVCAEIMPSGGKAPTSLIRSPGIRPHQNVGAGPGRGLAWHQDKLYAVSGTKLYQVPLAGAAGPVIEIGAIPGVKRVSMASSGVSLVVCSEPNLYGLTAGSFAQIADPDLRPAGKVDFLDGYFLFRERNSGRHFTSDLYALTFDALKFATAEGSPDKLLDFIVTLREAFFLGDKTGEIWWNSGAGNYPLERVANGVIEQGLKSGLTKADNSPFWHANDHTHRRLSGNVAQRISTHSVEEKLKEYNSDAYAFAYIIEGHVVVVFKYSGEATWCFDVTTGEYHERMSYGQADWRVCDAIEIGGVTYVQDSATSKVGILDANTYTEWGDPLVAAFTFPTVSDKGRMLFHNRLELFLEVGVGLPEGQGSDPEVMLEFSDDDGKTWFGAPNRTIGKVGKYGWRVFWNELGASVARVYRVSLSDPVRFNVTDASLDYEHGEV